MLFSRVTLPLRAANAEIISFVWVSVTVAESSKDSVLSEAFLRW